MADTSEVADLRTKLAASAADSAECAALRSEVRQLTRQLRGSQAQLEATSAQLAEAREAPSRAAPSPPPAAAAEASGGVVGLGIDGHALQRMEQRVASLGELLRGRELEVTALQNTVRRECEERTALLAQLARLTKAGK